MGWLASLASLARLTLLPLRARRCRQRAFRRHVALQGDERESIETRISELQRQYREVVGELRAYRAELKAIRRGLADCLQTAYEGRVGGKQGNWHQDCFIELDG